MSTTRTIFYNADDVDGEPGSPVTVTKTLIAAPNTATSIIGYFDTKGFQQRLPGVVVENKEPTLRCLTADLGGEKLYTYTIGGVAYKESNREALNVEESILHLTRATP